MQIQDIYSKVQTLHPSGKIRLEFSLGGVVVTLVKYDGYTVERSFWIDKCKDFGEEFEKEFTNLQKYGYCN
jgi:hypothetical protein